MLPLLNAEKVNEWDKKIRESHGLSSSHLVDNAAKNAYDITAGKVAGKRVLVLAGGGNNGSDALSYALLIKDVCQVMLWLVPGKANALNSSLRMRCSVSGIPTVTDIVPCDVIIDGIFGCAFHPPVDGPVLSMIMKANSSDAFKISMDVPSAYLFKADLCITFSILKREQYELNARKFSGKIILSNPGFPEDEIKKVGSDTMLLEDDDYSTKPFSDVSFKNRRGHVAILGGSSSYTGAPVLSAKASFHAGAGLVSIFTSSGAYASVSSYRPAIVRCSSFLDEGFDSLVLGPGWGCEGSRDAFFLNKKKVLDADAIKLIRKGDDFSSLAVITPHVGEFRRLCAALGIREDAKEASAAINAVIVLKSHVTEIAFGNKSYLYDGMNASLGVAGSGDVLSGIIGAFLACGQDVLEAAVNAVILHQKCGRVCRRKYGYYDSLELIGEVGLLR